MVTKTITITQKGGDELYPGTFNVEYGDKIAEVLNSDEVLALIIGINYAPTTPLLMLASSKECA